MVFSRLEQKILIDLFVAEKRDCVFAYRPTTYFFRAIELLEKNDCLRVKDGARKSFKLTVFGKCMASIIMKHPKGEPKLRKLANDVEMYLI